MKCFCFPGCTGQICIAILGNKMASCLVFGAVLRLPGSFLDSFFIPKSRKPVALRQKNPVTPLRAQKSQKECHFGQRSGLLCGRKGSEDYSLCTLGRARPGWQNQTGCMDSSTSTCHIVDIGDSGHGTRKSVTAAYSEICSRSCRTPVAVGVLFRDEKTEAFPPILEYSRMHLWTMQPARSPKESVLLHWLRFVNAVCLPFLLGFRAYECRYSKNWCVLLCLGVVQAAFVYIGHYCIPVGCFTARK